MENGKLYIQTSGQLFEAVQSSHIFPDQKTFTDAIPNGDPEIIIEKYKNQKDNSDFNLIEFVKTHFTLPEYAGSDVLTSDNGKLIPIEEYIENSWTMLTRLSLTKNPFDTSLQLPSPYVVPGGRFREMYYWDSFFTALGLIHHKRYDLLYGICNNYAHSIKKYGYIPNASRTYLLGRSQPPTFILLVHLLSRTRRADVYNDYLEELEKEYMFWMDGEASLGEGESFRRVVNCKGFILNRYYDDSEGPRPEAFDLDCELTIKSNSNNPNQIYKELRAGAESGWDYSGRWFTNHKTLDTINTTSIIPVDLNTLLYIYERKFAQWFAKNGNEQKSKIYAIRSENRKKAIQTLLFSDHHGFYTDYILGHGQSEYLTLAGVFPLYGQIADLSQARHVLQTLENKFLYSGGLVTSLNETNEQWDYPNGWAPLQWIAARGVEKYYHQELADTIKQRWNALVRETYNNNGVIYEKYNVVEPNSKAQDGEYAMQTGFGWTNGVYMDFAKSSHNF